MSKFRVISRKFQLLQKSCAIVPCFSKSFTRVVEYPEFSTLYYGGDTSIISDHLKNTRVDETRNLFNDIPSPNVCLATKMIFSYVDNYRLDEALELFDKMPVKDVVTWKNMIKGCVDRGNIEMGLKLFDEIPERNVISWTTVLNAMWKCGDIVLSHSSVGVMLLAADDDKTVLETLFSLLLSIFRFVAVGFSPPSSSNSIK